MRALKKLSKRTWLEQRDLWIDHLPQIDFESECPAPTLIDLPKLDHPQINASGVAECDYVAGIREAILREALLLVRKFIYCCSVLPTLSDAGKNTWTAVASYEASFYGAKAFCYLLGFASLGRDSNLYLDAFYETEVKQGKQRVKSHDIVRIHRLDGRLSHSVLWALTERLIDTTIFDEELREYQTRLKIQDWNRFSSLRNRVFYEGSFWPMSSEWANCDLVRPVAIADIADAARLGEDSSTPFGGEYFSTTSLFNGLIAGMLSDIATIAPAMNTEVEAFGALRPAA